MGLFDFFGKTKKGKAQEAGTPKKEAGNSAGGEGPKDPFLEGWDED